MTTVKTVSLHASASADCLPAPVATALLFAALVNLTLALQAAQTPAADYSIQEVSVKTVQVNDVFWSPRLDTNRAATIPHLFKENAANHRLDNLKRAAHLMDGAFVGRRYDDTDVFKLLEAVAFTLMQHPDPELKRIADEQIDIIAKGQEPDGYIYAARTIDPKHPAPGAGAERWSRLGGSHELYNMGHLIEAAVAYSQATGDRKFLNVATKCADMLCRTFGPNKRHDTSGHEEIELALVKLYRATGQRKYADLAQFFIDQRGQKHTFGDYTDDAPAGFRMYNDRAYRQDDKPVVDQTEAEGHAVRAAYLYCGLTDVAALTGLAPYRTAADRLWDSVVGRKLYLTGGIGSTGGTEAFAGDYVLPNAAYCESCAAIGNALWNERLFRLHGDAKYLDVMERIVYNGLLSGVALRGDRFFYQNPMQSSGRRGGRRGAAAGGEQDDTGPSTGGEGPRQPWFDVACCPANLARFIAQFPGYIYATRGDTLYVNFFVGSTTEVTLNGQKVRVRQDSRYPWDGDVKITLEPETSADFTVNVRAPGWVYNGGTSDAQGKPLPTDLYSYIPLARAGMKDSAYLAMPIEPRGLSTNAAPKDGFYSVRRTWKKGDVLLLHLPMVPRQVVAHEKVQADRGLVALERGPLVYCVEGIDNDGRVSSLTLARDAVLTAEFKPDLLGGVTMINATNGSQKIVAVPYYAWGNRGNGEMRIWLPRPDDAPDKGSPPAQAK